MKSLVLLLPGLFDQPYEILDSKTPLEVAKTPTLERWAQSGAWLKAPWPQKGKKQIWAELLGLNAQKFDLSESALEVYARQIPFKHNQCSFIFEFRTKIDDNFASYDATLLKEEELHFLTSELNQHFKDLATWIATKDSKGVALFWNSNKWMSENEPIELQKRQEIEAFLQHHPLNQLRLDFEEPLCNGLCFHTPGVPLNAIAASTFYERYSLFSSSSSAKGLAELLSISHQEISKAKDLSHFSDLVKQIENELDHKKYLVLECDDLMESHWENSILEKIKRLEAMDRLFFSKLDEVMQKKPFQLLISPMLTPEKNAFVPWLHFHPKKNRDFKLSFHEKAAKAIEKMCATTHLLHSIDSY